MKPKNQIRNPFKTQATGFALILTALAAGLSSSLAQDVWTGSGSDSRWQTPGNWFSGTPPSAGDQLVFTGVNGLSNTNNFLAGTAFGGLYFKATAGAFVLNGNSITLNGNITNSQVVTPQTINLPVTLSTTPLVDIVPNGILNVSSVLSGSGGLTTVDGGQLNLTGANTFTGPVTVNAGTVAVGANANLGAVPAVATPGDIVLNGGILRATNTFTLSANRGIALGSASGGVGTIKVDAGFTMTYAGILAGNGGAGGLAKSSFGGLTLSAPSTYTGPTIIKNGTVTLDYTQAGSPVNNLINSGSSLTLGGETAGVGNINNSTLAMLGKATTVNSQTFNGTLIDLGLQIIQATNSTGGTANINLGSVTHNSGGALIVTPPPTGNISTTSANLNGILGGWATIGSGANQNGVLLGTNFATVNGSGNIINYSGYFNWSSGNLAGQITGASNLFFAPISSAQVVQVDADNAASTTDLNAVKIFNPTTFSGIYIGIGNTLRLGKFGGILAQETAAAPVVTLGGNNNGVQSGNGNAGSQDIGILTAGGAPNTPGEIVLGLNNNNETSGSFIIESTITDNGSGPVTFVKNGPGPMKLDGHNSYSGGTYLLAGRLQLAGTEIGTGNPGGAGTGPIFVYPGAELFPSGAGTVPITNAIFLAGNGVSDNVGAIRLSGVFSNGLITLIGDTRIGGGSAVAPTPIYDQITGNFNLDMGAVGNAGSAGNGAILYNTNNNWSGNTTLVGRTGTAGNTVWHSGASEVIPDGFGKGNLQLGNSGNTVSVTAWDMNGFNETINGLISIGTVPSLMYISNNVANAQSTLTVGNNDQSGLFSGAILGNILLTKTGAGVETLSGTNLYTGNTVVNAGKLALSGGGSISNSPNCLVQNGAIFDVTAVTGGSTYPNNLGLNTGVYLIGTGNKVGSLNTTNGRLRLATLGATPNLTATTVNLGGATNYVDLITVGSVPGYPVQFPVVKYTGTLNGTFNFGLGNVPSASTTGYISNNVANSSIDVVLLSGPEPLTWTGLNGSPWDVNTTINWLAFGTTPSVFHQVDAVTFNDSGSTGTINLTTSLNPGLVEVTNNTLNYIFTGVGNLGGFGTVTKDGTASLTLDNAGGSSFTGGFLINNGTVQVGNNDTSGSLPTVGGVQNNAALVFNHTDNINVSSTIIGTGSLTQNNVNVLTLSGNNTFSGPVTVAQGTLQAGSPTALGTGTNTVVSGATLDVNGQTLDTVPVVVSGTGVGGLGAIVNSGLDSLNAMGNVTLAGNTTIGGTGRWDIRGGSAILSTGGNNYSLTKIGTNQTSIVGVTVDGGLGDINVLNGTLSIETTTTSLGNSGNTLTVASGATLQFFNSTTAFSKQFVLNGNGLVTTLNAGAGFANTISGPVTVNGNCIFSAGAGSGLTFNSSLSGSGSVVKIGAGTNLIANGVSAGYTGGTTVSNGFFVVNGSLTGAATVTTGATLGGKGTVGGAVSIAGGTLSPGDIIFGVPAPMNISSLSMNTGTVLFHLSSSPAGANDQVVSSGALSFAGINTIQIAPLAFMNVGDNFTLFTYTGATLPSTVTNNLQIATSAGFAFSFVDPATTPGSIQIHVIQAIGNELWTGQTSSTWNTTDINWNRNSSFVAFNNGDFVNFDDSSSVNGITLAGPLQIGNMTMNNNSKTYTFGGAGSLTGTGGLLMNGSGNVIFANTSTNTFSGPITINSGVLQLGNGGSGGNVGTGVITNNGSLVLDRGDTNLVQNNIISGNGGVQVTGTGTVTLGGASTYAGEVDVLSGTLRATSSGALGNASGETVVSTGATLDIANAANVSKEIISIAGSGVNGNGAIINSSGSPTFVGPNIGNIYMNGDLTIGGPGRLDFRASTAIAQDAILLSFGAPYNLIKTSTNLFQMAGVQIDPGLGDIDVQSGTFGIQWQIPGLGNPGNNLNVGSNASFAFFDVSNSVSKVLVLTNGASVLGQHGNANVFNGSVTLLGTNTFNVSTATTLTFQSPISGTGPLVCNGVGNLILSTGPLTYTGNTVISLGTLSLTDVASLNNSPNIVLSNAVLDVSGRTDGTLTLNSAHTLLGGGAVKGILTENSGATINPGNGVTTAILTVSNSAALNGNVIMDLDRTNALKNDVFVSPTITASGTLTVNNLGPDLVTGDRFQLFSNAVSGFASVNLPVHNVANTITYVWQNNVSVDGSVTVLSGASGLNTNPTNIVAVVTGNQLILSWPADHTGWFLQAQTNSLNTGLSANWVTIPNSNLSNGYTNTIDSTRGTVFYRMVH